MPASWTLGAGHVIVKQNHYSCDLYTIDCENKKQMVMSVGRSIEENNRGIEFWGGDWRVLLYI